MFLYVVYVLYAFAKFFLYGFFHLDVASIISIVSGFSRFAPLFMSVFSRYVRNFIVASDSPLFFMCHANDSKKRFICGKVLFSKGIIRLNCSGVNLGAHSTSIQQTVEFT